MIGAIASITILIVIAAIHVYWAGGGQLGKGAAIPELNGRPVLRPSAAVTYLVAACLLGAAALIAMRAGLLPSAGYTAIPRVATWIFVLLFAVRAVGDFRYVGFFKRVRGTRFAFLDTLIYSPLCCLLAISIADVARI